jgi:hypothetical protein
MGTVIIINNNTRFQVFSNDHLPAHCHVFAPGAHAKIRIEDGVCYEVEGFSAKAVKKLEQKVREHQVELMEEWRRCHEKPKK